MCVCVMSQFVVQMCERQRGTACSVKTACCCCSNLGVLCTASHRCFVSLLAPTAQWLSKSYLKDALTKVTHWIHYSRFSFTAVQALERIAWSVASNSSNWKRNKKEIFVAWWVFELHVHSLWVSPRCERRAPAATKKSHTKKKGKRGGGRTTPEGRIGRRARTDELTFPTHYHGPQSVCSLLPPGHFVKRCGTQTSCKWTYVYRENFR